MAALGTANDAVVGALAWDRLAIADGEFWRLLTGHLVHTNWTHVAMNLGGLGLLTIALGRSLSARRWVVAAVGSGLAIGLWLYFLTTWPDTYVGLSGVLHALFATALVVATHARQLLALILLLALCVKVVLEVAFNGSEVTESLIGVPVVTSAHLIGVAFGSVAGIWYRYGRGLIGH